jgi:hypothetical protein
MWCPNLTFDSLFRPIEMPTFRPDHAFVPDTQFDAFFIVQVAILVRDTEPLRNLLADWGRHCGFMSSWAENSSTIERIFRSKHAFTIAARNWGSAARNLVTAARSKKSYRLHRSIRGAGCASRCISSSPLSFWQSSNFHMVGDLGKCGLWASIFLQLVEVDESILDIAARFGNRI